MMGCTSTSDSESELDPSMITSSSLSVAFFESKYREVRGARPGRSFVFLLFRDGFPLAELDLRFEGRGLELQLRSGMKSGDGDLEGVEGGEGLSELSG